MRCDSLYLSPHLDDAVLSCAARILKETTAGLRVVVATLFTEADTEREPLYRERRAEDISAVESLGARTLHLGLKDAPFRRSYYSSFRAIVLGALPTDGEDEADARRCIADVLRVYQPDRVYCPLAVGTHIDHRLTYQAAVAVHGLDRLTFYEDRPYALVDGHLSMRLAELAWQTEVPTVSPNRFLDSFRAARYVRTYLGSQRAECEDVLVSKLQREQARGRPLVAELITSGRTEEIIAAIARYQTQLGDLYGDIDGLRHESVRYAALLGSTTYAERYWGAAP